MHMEIKPVVESWCSFPYVCGKNIVVQIYATGRLKLKLTLPPICSSVS